MLGLLINEPQHDKAAQEEEEDHQDGDYEDVSLKVPQKAIA